MKRIIYQSLKDWKGKKGRKPLILMGARQTGKTYTLKDFGQNDFQNTAYLNFEDNPHLKTLFDNRLDPQQIIQAIAVELETDISPEHTLIILDEIQECPNALNSLKYFNEKARHYHICAAGSLLGVTLAHTKGFPVGQVDFLHLHPLNFYEFLLANQQTKLANYLNTINHIEPIAENLHLKLIDYFKKYLYIGGMPEAVTSYLDSENFAKVREIQQSILDAYQLDFAKHTPKNQIMRIQQVWQAIPSQLAKENRKFIYSAIRKGARAKEYEIALQWLKEAGLIHKVFNLSAPKLPLNAYANFNHFKVYLVDVGLLGAMNNVSAKAVIHDQQILTEFKGILVENYASQTLAESTKDLFYWSSEGRAEVDFILQTEDSIYPLEIKSGTSNKKKSLGIYTNKYQPTFSIRASLMNLRLDNNLLNCPLYLLSNLQELINMV